MGFFDDLVNDFPYSLNEIKILESLNDAKKWQENCNKAHLIIKEKIKSLGNFSNFYMGGNVATYEPYTK